jgi:Lyzozyme M1 (1,4-beta-N-acetylmuramidase)
MIGYQGIYGFDISSHQDSPVITGTVDFEKMVQFGGRFVGFRASIGLAPDDDFPKFWENSRGLLPRFVYHYYVNTKPPQDQARTFYNAIKADLPPVCVLDIEDKQSGFIGWRYWYDFLVELQHLTGLPNDQIWIYTNETYFAECAGPITTAQRDWFKRFPLWLASYFADPFHPNWQYVNTPSPWTDADVIMVQSGTPAVGRQAGVESLDIDLDLFNGDSAKLARILGGEAPQPPTGETMKEGTVIVTKLNIRQGPGTGYGDIGDLFHGDRVYGDVDIASGWFFFSKVLRVDGTIGMMNAWCAVTSLGTTCLTLRDVTDPGPEPIVDYITAHFTDGTTRRYVPE